MTPEEKAKDYLRRKGLYDRISVGDLPIVNSAIYIAVEEAKKEHQKELDAINKAMSFVVNAKDAEKLKVRIETAKEIFKELDKFIKSVWLDVDENSLDYDEIKARFLK